MRQQKFARTSEPSDDGLAAFCNPLERLGADTIIVAIRANDTTRISQSNACVINTVRDQFSGMALAWPSSTKSSDAYYENLKSFAGVIGGRSPHILVKSDAAGEIIKAVKDLGWHSEASLANTWPHNATHERWIGTYKSILRSSLHQSGLPIIAWHLAVAYSSIAPVSYTHLTLPTIYSV